MKWLKRKIDAHNKKLTYADYEEHWTIGEWIYSLTTLVSLSMAPFAISAVSNNQLGLIIPGVCISALVVLWHFWSIMH